ncbi:hypothetical protein LPTSP4_35000 [Leptospira ryugenii]|uniref:Uncharacterized protein n=1 Tax=Leptospira ryugenii TaxID=1917863 RepID=A0A2P2E521_9LEPT|nr:hypothetical protein [Leptospira ryugenii]GBF51962.1 hypothetical protein LPTSP4_35000 [Leptospira ryugenii]
MAESKRKQDPKPGEIPPRRKGGLKAAFEQLVEKAVAYWEVMLVYIEKNLQLYVKRFIVSSVWIVSSLFLVLIAFVYLSFGIFLSIQKYVANGDPILASFLTALCFFILTFALMEIVLKKRK